MLGKGGRLPKQTTAFPRWSAQCEWGEPPRVHGRMSAGECSVHRGREGLGHRAGPQSETPSWEVCLEKLLGSWLSQPTVKNHPFHLLGEETFQQVWRQTQGGWSVWVLKQIFRLLWLCLLYTWVNCSFGFCSDSRCGKPVEASLRHTRQLEGGIFWQEDGLMFCNLWCLKIWDFVYCCPDYTSDIFYLA